MVSLPVTISTLVPKAEATDRLHDRFKSCYYHVLLHKNGD